MGKEISSPIFQKIFLFIFFLIIILNMSEKNLGLEKQSNQFKDYYHWLSVRFPEGLTGVKNAIPITIDGNEMELIIFKPESNYVSFGLFLHDNKYSRKTLIINSNGLVSEDTSGVLPDLDKAENEPEINSSNEQIVIKIMDTIKNNFPDN
jgi:hypothetical protein